MGPVDRQSPGSAKPPVLLSSIVFGLSVLFWPRGVRQSSTDSELLWLRVFARCLLFDFHVGHTLFPVWADTRTASFRALGHTRVVSSAPTLIYAPFWNKNVRELPL